jgi:hypothetical protein
LAVDGHDHRPDEPCLPACPAWTELALQFYALRRSYAEMLEACRAAPAIEWVDVAPGAPGTVLPEHLQGEDVVRLNLVVGRDAPEVLLDEWGIRCNLTFRGRRVDCAFPWASVLRGALRRPERKRPRFGVIESPPSTEPATTEPAERERPRLGIIKGGRKD